MMSLISAMSTDQYLESGGIPPCDKDWQGLMGYFGLIEVD